MPLSQEHMPRRSVVDILQHGLTTTSMLCLSNGLLENLAFDRDETRTRNLLIRSQTPYPLGHAAAIL